MIFRRLTLENFRQFENKQIIEFATEPDRNVTVCHGFNGSGKTTLLNAFTWLIYGEGGFTPDFTDTDRLDNEAVFDQLQEGEILIVSVKLEFENRDLIHTAERRIQVKKDVGNLRIASGAELTLRYIDAAGEVQEPGNAQDYMLRLIPEKLFPFFFFNGERIERLAGPAAYNEIESGVKVLLDLELFDRAIDHLTGDASRKLRQEVASHSGEEGQIAQAELERLESEKSDLQREVEQITKNRTAYEEEKEAIDTKLAAMPELARLQAERRAAENDLEDVKGQLKNIRIEIARAVSRSGYLLLVPDVMRKADDVLSAAHKKGELPIPIKRQFVDELLNKEQCICGRELTPGAAPHGCVVQWRNKAGSQELEAAATITKANLQTLMTRRDQVQQDLDRLQAARGRLLQRIRFFEEQLSELHRKIGDRDRGEDPVKLESRRHQIEGELEKMKFDIYEKDKQLQRLQEQINDQIVRIKNLENADAKGKLAQKRLEAVTAVTTALQKIRAIRHDELRKDLAARLGEVWGRISIKDYRAEVDEHYHLLLTKEIAGRLEPVRGASTGEKQVLSLAFVGSLVDKARATYAESKKDPTSFFQGGLYALVMDSPFGSLEDEYRREVARWIPTLAPQVVVMVSQTQWRREVEEELQSRIGREWVLRLTTAKNKSRAIQVRGHEYEYVVESVDGYERTNIVEVPR